MPGYTGPEHIKNRQKNSDGFLGLAIPKNLPTDGTYCFLHELIYNVIQLSILNFKSWLMGKIESQRIYFATVIIVKAYSHVFIC